MGRLSRRVLESNGFTLIELMVVVLIISALVAIAVPIYGHAENNAKFRTCQSNLRAMDGSIQAYTSRNLASPVSLEDLVPDYLVAIPGEPSAGSYSLTGPTNKLPAHAVCSRGHIYP